MADFDKAYGITTRIEAGWVNDPKDNGGETYAGISRKNFPDWPGWAIIDSMKKYAAFPGNLKDSTVLADMKRKFYKVQIWDRLLLDQANNQNIANELFDLAVNCGYPTAVFFLQRSLNVTNDNQRRYPDIEADKKMGPATLKILNDHPRPMDVLKCIVALQGARYILIAETDHDQERFMSGWINRAFEQFKLN